MLTKIRETVAKMIAQNPYTIVQYKRELISNGYDVMIPDMTKTAVAYTLGTARIARRRLPDPITTNASSPYDYQDVYYLMAEYTATWLKAGIVFEYNGNKFKTLLLENKIINGGIAYKICDLEQVTSGDIGDQYA